MTSVHFPFTPDWLFWRYPWVLSGLVLLIPLWWLWLRPRRRSVIRYSDTSVLAQVGARRGQGARILLPILLSGAIAALTIACARPQRADTTSYEFAEGIAIQLVVDVSGSMEADDLVRRGSGVTRLDVVKRVVHEFVTGEGRELPGRPNDLIGLIRFGTFPDSICPLTLDRESLTQFISELETLQTREEGNTAIGDALALAVERLKDLKRTSGSGEQYTVTSRIVILLTDGQDNASEIEPVEAGQLAANFGIKVYTILAGTGEIRGSGFFERTFPVDDSALREIAETTGGEFFSATDVNSLVKIYEQIDQLERTKTEERRYEHFGELAWPLLAASFLLLALHALLDSTMLRKTT
ncbi:MAG: VWA domain-containing protein [Phycisphaerae bacterium]